LQVRGDKRTSLDINEIAIRMFWGRPEQPLFPILMIIEDPWRSLRHALLEHGEAGPHTARVIATPSVDGDGGGERGSVASVAGL
jgi:hypothetical protein